NERDGTVTAVDLPSGHVAATVSVGGPRGDDYAHAEGLAVDPVHDRLYVAVTDRDLLTVVDTKALRAERFVDVGRPPLPLGVAPLPCCGRSPPATARGIATARAAVRSAASSPR